MQEIMPGYFVRPARLRWHVEEYQNPLRSRLLTSLAAELIMSAQYQIEGTLEGRLVSDVGSD